MSNSSLAFFAIVLVYCFYVLSPEGYRRPNFGEGRNAITSVSMISFQQLLDDGKTFKDLVEDGRYTIIEGYVRKCAACKLLEAKFPAFVAAREDVVIRRILFNSDSSKLFNAKTEAEHKKQVAEYGKTLSQFSVFDVKQNNGETSIGTCDTPHIEIYSPEGALLAADSCKQNHKQGLRFLEKWIKDETGE